MQIKLMEIIWEVTLNCNKECEFCGSKDVINSGFKEISDDDKIKLAQDFNSYGVREVVLSGGEPGCLSTKVLKSIIGNLIKGNRCDVEIVTNGKIFEHKLPWKKIRRIGLSVNTLDEINYWNNKKLPVDFHNMTLITNFGNHNLKYVRYLFEFSKLFGAWQVQLTMGKKYQLNKNDIAFLRSELNDLDGGIDGNIIRADNLQDTHNCTAGFRACGVLANGDVVACLAERCFCNKMKTYGNLLDKSIKDIWESEFKDIRFDNTRKCCRDFISYPNIIVHSGKYDPTITQILYGVWPTKAVDYPNYPNPKIPNFNDVYVYGVTDYKLKSNFFNQD